MESSRSKFGSMWAYNLEIIKEIVMCTVCPLVAESPPRKFGPLFFGRHSGPNWSDFWQHLLLQQYNILQRKSSLTVVCIKVHKIASVWCKTALGEVGVSLP